MLTSGPHCFVSPPALAAGADAALEDMQVGAVVAGDPLAVVRTCSLEALVAVAAHSDADAHLAPHQQAAMHVRAQAS